MSSYPNQSINTAQFPKYSTSKTSELINQEKIFMRLQFHKTLLFLAWLAGSQIVRIHMD